MNINMLVFLKIIPKELICLLQAYFPLGRLGGNKDGVFPGVSLLSLCLLSGFPVEIAVLFGPGFKPMLNTSSLLINHNILIKIVIKTNFNSIFIIKIHFIINQSNNT